MAPALASLRALTIVVSVGMALAGAAACDPGSTARASASSTPAATRAPSTSAATSSALPRTASSALPRTTSPAPSRTGSSKLHAAAAAIVRAGEPGAIVVSRRGTKVIGDAAGLARKTPALAMDHRDRVHIGSITKTLVSTVALQLVAEHKLALTDPLSKVLPGVLAGTQYDPTSITVRELLQHTSGIRDYVTDPRFETAAGLRRMWTPTQLVDIAVQQGSPFTAWSYSNTNYVLLGMIIERITGHSLGDELRTRIITPLHLTETSFPLTAKGIARRHADGYFTPHGDVTTSVSPSVLWAAGGLISTASDVARFMSALMNGTLLPRAQLQQLTTTIPVKDEGLFPERYGLGIYSVHLPCGTAWGHDGDFPGFRSYAFTNRAGTRQGVVIDNDSGLSDQPDNPALRSALQKAAIAAFCG